MSNDDFRKELERLREQVAALSKTKRPHDGTQESDDEDDTATDAEQGETEHAVRKQIEDIINMLKEEIHDMPAMPTLAVFMLGVFVGRYLR